LLEESGLSEPIQLYIRGLRDRSGLAISLDITDDLGRLPGEMELIIFHIVQECVTIISRHSGTANAAIRIHRNEKGLFLEVQDDVGACHRKY
jgi:two-component system, NarL family, sensor kinase